MNNNSKLFKQIILKKMQAAKLPPFFILRSEDNSQLVDWIKDLYLQYLEKTIGKTISNLENYADFLHLTPPLNNNGLVIPYKKDDFQSFFKFLNFAGFESKQIYRLIFVEQADLLGSTVSNNILKSLEELPQNCLVFFSVASQKQLLPTIESRAITISLTFDCHDNQNKQLDILLKDLESFINEQVSLSELLDSSKNINHYQLQRAACQMAINSKLEGDKSALFLKLLKELEINSTYHNSKQAALTQVAIFFKNA